MMGFSPRKLECTQSTRNCINVQWKLNNLSISFVHSRHEFFIIIQTHDKCIHNALEHLAAEAVNIN